MNQQKDIIRDARVLGTPKMLLLGLQHMFAMFGATILVPILVNSYFQSTSQVLSVQVTLFCAGFGTLFFHLCTKFKVPAFLGSSFAFLGGFSSVAALDTGIFANMADKEKLQERLAKMAGGVAVLYVGAPSEVEMKEKKDRVDDALHATRAAIEEGTVPGGGVAYIRAIEALEGLKGENEDETTGIEIVKRAIEEPLRQIVANAGKEGAVVVQKVKEGKGDFGYNARTDKYENLCAAGVIDPAKVTRSALQNATSVASTLLTTESVVADIKEDTPAPAMPAGGRRRRSLPPTAAAGTPPPHWRSAGSPRRDAPLRRPVLLPPAQSRSPTAGRWRQAAYPSAKTHGRYSRYRSVQK